VVAKFNENGAEQESVSDVKAEKIIRVDQESAEHVKEKVVSKQASPKSKELQQKGIKTTTLKAQKNS
jgi:hypothetical protein